MRTFKMFIFATLFGAMIQQSMLTNITPAYAADNMEQVQLILKKLKSSMQNMKDFDELEKAGMDKRDVDRLRNAMRAKIRQMTSDAVDLIRVL